MANPTRPTTLAVIETAWGLAVADSVLRVYPNAASRDADLAGISSAELLGQACVLLDSGALLVYAGAVMGWRPPWSLPWGMVPGSMVSSTLAVTGTAAAQSILSTVPTVTLLAGRAYRISATGTLTCSTPGQLSIVTGAGPYVGRVFPFGGGEFSMSHLALVAQGSTATGPVDLKITGVGTNAAGAMGTHRLVVEDIGPSANPTALVLRPDTSLPEVDPALLEPAYAAAWASYDQPSADLEQADVDTAADDLERGQ